jgi:ureidoglycolate lyase
MVPVPTQLPPKLPFTTCMLSCTNVTASGTVPVEPLIGPAFEAYGDVIEVPTDDAGKYDDKYGNISIANQGSAIKFANVARIVNSYGAASNVSSSPAMSLFICYPTGAGQVVGEYGATKASGSPCVPLTVLERHKFTTQTFVPMGLAEKRADTAFIVAVTKSVAGIGQSDGPDRDGIKAFIGHGKQAISYHAGTWHAPMMVVGTEAIQFCVFQYVNGVGCDDCEQVTLDPAMEISMGVHAQF